jgi:hypothetical protein
MERNDDFLNPHEQPEYECKHCEKPLYTNKYYCSWQCRDADLL